MTTAIDIFTGETIKPIHKREHKGKNKIFFPNNYCVIDVETTGLSPDWDDIIEIAALKFENCTLVDTFSYLVRPDSFSDDEPYLDDFIVSLTGITDEMLSSAQPTASVLSKFKDFIGNYTLVGHNINFDVNFLYDNLECCNEYYLSNDFVDTMRISRKLLPELPHHRLCDLVEHYKIDCSTAHRALLDATMTAQCYSSLLSDIKEKFRTIEEFEKLFHSQYKRVRASDITSSNENIDSSNPLFGKVCVFTGALEKMVRKDAMQLVANLGGINADNVTKKTNYLVLGNNDYCSSIKDGKSSKQKKAEKLKLSGQDIEIIPENVFYDIVFCD